MGGGGEFSAGSIVFKLYEKNYTEEETILHSVRCDATLGFYETSLT